MAFILYITYIIYYNVVLILFVTYTGTGTDLLFLTLSLDNTFRPHNFCDTDGRRIKFFTDEQRDFLSMAKTKYDPTNLLSLNKNIISHSE